MLYQVLSADKSLRNTVKCITTWLTVAGEAPPSTDTGAYSKARGRLSEGLLQRLVPETAEALGQEVPEAHYAGAGEAATFSLIAMLRVGGLISLAIGHQHGGAIKDFHPATIPTVSFFCLLTGAVVAACVAAKTTSEIVMSRLLYQD